MRYENLNIWDGESRSHPKGALVVSDGLFVSEAIDPDGQARDMGGLFAIPGLIDAHVHMCLDPELKDPLQQTLPAKEKIVADIRKRASMMVRAGITTARDLGGGEFLEIKVRDEIAAGKTLGPRLVCAGQPITSVGGHCHFWGGEASGDDEAIAVLERQREKGVDLIKMMVTGGNITPGSRPIDSQFDDQTVTHVVALAKQYGFHVAAHCHGTNGIRQAALAGVTTVEHCSWVGESGWGKAFDTAVVSLMANNGVWVSPTINAGWKRFTQKAFTEMVQQNYRKMKEAGIRLIASTDAGIPNVFHHDLPSALPVFAHFAGLSAEEVLRAATSDCAEAIGLGGVTGLIRPGYSADFVLYEEDPLVNLEALKEPVMVVSRGREIQMGESSSHQSKRT
jgi:imidazolonepropionase-like amidohydrolase